MFWNYQIVDDRKYGVTYFRDAMKYYRADSKFADRKGLNGFEVYLLDLLESAAINIRSIGYSSDRRIDLENIIQEAKEKDEKLGISAEPLNEHQQTEYSVCRYIGNDIDRLEKNLIELASYFDIDWVGPEQK